MVLAYSMLTAEMLFLALEFVFFSSIRAERPFVLKTGNCSPPSVFGTPCYRGANASAGNNFWAKISKWLFK